MKLKHTQKKSANRGQSPSEMYRGMSQHIMNMLFSPKHNSKTTRKRGGFNKTAVYPTGGKLGKQRDRASKVQQPKNR